MNFYELPNKSKIAADLLEFASKSTAWVDYYNFNAVQVPDKLLHKDPFFTELASKFAFAVGIVRLDPFVCYNWHIDTKRGVGINMLLNPEIRSSCVFSSGDGVKFNIEELKYAQDTYYVFNTQIPHMVLNYESTRYLLTIEFALNKDNLTFEHLIAAIK